MTNFDKISNLKKGVTDAIDAVFAMCKAIDDNDLSGQDLLDGCRLAIKDGHDMAQLELQVMAWAVGESKKKNRKKRRKVNCPVNSSPSTPEAP